MNVHVPSPIETRPRLDLLDERIAAATRALCASQKPDGHWCFELEGDATIPAEYVLLRHYLAEEPDLPLEAKIGVYLRRLQGAHGGWPLYHGGPFEISASVKAYFGLKMIGDDIEAPHMVRARAAILAHGGASAANVFTRFLLALYGEIDWNQVPTMPVELMLAPRWFPVHIDKMSYWARTTIVPLLVLQALKPRARNPRGIGVAELFGPDRPRSAARRAPHQKPGWSLFFHGLDRVLKWVDPFWPKSLRRRAIESAVAYVTERLNGEDGIGAIYPPMASSVMMFDILGYPESHPDRAIARRAVDKLLVIGEEEAYCQACVSPVWDTALAAHALLEVGGAEAERRAEQALDWLAPLQVLDVKGDWAGLRPDVRPGGWAFQYRNDHFPDTDDTAVVVMAMDRVRNRTGTRRYDAAIARGAEWVVGLQSRNGGWGAFDAENTCYYLNNIPFADHGALLDPPTVDVSGRCIGMLAQLGDGPGSPRMQAALAYIQGDQEADGSWFGRWGVNYVYGTWSALCGLNAAGLGPDDPVVRRGADWLLSIQNQDGGWGEDCDSYRLDYGGYEPAPSTPSQTAWALLGLMAAGQVDHPGVARGIAYLQDSQGADGLWSQDQHTGGGFPRVFYLRYHGYPRYFPLWALARYRNLRRSNERRVLLGL